MDVQEYTCARDYQLFGPGPKRILALDGGGVRGAITVAFLERIESIISQRAGQPIRLGDYFHLVGGTSTGSVIAGAIALGFRAEQVKELYTQLAPLAFKRQRWAVPVLQAKFDVRGLRGEIAKIVGEIDLQSDKLITGLCVVTKRMDTGSPWILANNPEAPFWNDGMAEDGSPYDGNKYYKLATLVRASTAAPHFFDPELLPISGRTRQLPHEIASLMQKSYVVRFTEALLQHLGLREKPVKRPDGDFGLFVDGGVSPHNNPSFALLQMAVLKPFGIRWPLGAGQLSVTSIGTGTFRPRLKYEDLGFTRYPQLALQALMSLMTDAETLTLAQMQWLGECPAPWRINSEIGTLADDGPPGGKLFRFLRYDVKLETDWLDRELGLRVSASDVARYRCMDDPGIVHSIYEIAKAAAVKQVQPEHFLQPAESKSPAPLTA